jgi:homeobox protein cut-like
MSKNISTIVELWTKFELEAVKRELDDKIIEIARQLEEGDDARKRLIEQTKDFRKGLTEEQRKLIGPMLKLFQVEVDTSTKRSKLMEQVLLKLYKQLIDVPDPVPVLESVQRLQKKAERSQDLEVENKKLRETLDEYNVEFAEVKNQEVTIKALKDKIKDLEDKSEQLVQSKLKEREKELQRAFTDKDEQFKTNQFELVKKLGDTEARNMTLQAQIQKLNTDLYEIKSKQDELLNGKSLEIDMLLQDSEKMNERVLNAERLNDQYTQQIASMKLQLQTHSSQVRSEIDQLVDGADGMDSQRRSLETSTLEVELAAKEKEISHLVDDIQKLQLKSNKTREFYETQRCQLEEKLASREQSLEQYEYELKKKQDYDEIKKELSILKAIEFGGMTSQYESSSGGLTPSTESPSNVK